jgi:iron complex outermembrane receptor protein
MPTGFRGLLPVLAAVWLCATPPAPGASPRQGVVIDSESGRAVEGAHVRLAGGTAGTVSDSRGRFELDCGPGDSLEVSHVAFDTRRLAAEDTDPDAGLRVELVPRLLSLKTLVVLGGAGEAGSRFGQVRSHANSTEEALAQVENLTLVRRGGYAHDPQIRGLSAARLDLRVDGMVVHGACTDRMDPVTSYLDLDAIAEADIQPGAGDGRSGTAGGGSIRLSHRSASLSDVPRLEARLALSAADALDQGGLSLRLERSAPRHGLLVYGSFEEAGNYQSPAGREPFSGHRKANAYGSLRLHSRRQGDWHLLLQTDDAWDVGYAALPMDVGYARYRAISLENSRSLAGRWFGRLDTQVYHNRVDHWMDDSTRDILLMGMHMDMPGFTRTSGLRVENTIGPVPNLLLRTGVEAFSVNQLADMLMRPENSATMYLLTWPDVHSETVATWLEAQQQRGRLRLRCSGRLEWRRMEARSEQGLAQIRLSLPDAPASRHDLPASVTLAADWQLSTALEAGLGLSVTRRAPSTTEAYAYYLYVANDGYLYSGNPRLGMEKSLQAEGRLAYRTDHGEARLTVYHYELEDVIRGLPDPGEVDVPFANGWRRYGNGGRARLNGLELRGRVTPGGPWHLEASGALQRAWFLDTGDPLPDLLPPSGQFNIVYNRKGSGMLLGLQAVAPRDHPSRAAGETPLPGYTLLKARLDHRATPDLHLSLGADNLLDRSYRQAGDWGTALRPGRTVWARVEWTMDNTP